MVFYNPLNRRSTAFPSNPRQWPEKAVVREQYGERALWHTVQDGGRHVTADDLEEYRQIGDPAVDRIFTLRQEEGRPIKAGEDLLAAAALASSNNRVGSERALYELYQTYSRIPSWVDQKVLQRGKDVYLAYLPAVSLSLYYRSLVPGFSIPRIAAVLESTGYLAPPGSRQEVHNRLMDTGLLLMKCFGGATIDDILPGGAGWKTCLQVRFLHAKVRQGLLRRQGNRAWDTATLGIPINEEDMNATLLAFAVNPLLGAEMLMGFPIPERDRLDYLAIWRYLGWLLGVPVQNECKSDAQSDVVTRDSSLPRPLDPCGPGWKTACPSPIDHAHAVFQSIILHLLHPNDLSVKIAHHLLWQGQTQDASPEKREDEERWYYYRALQCRRFVGKPLADALRLPLHKNWLRRMKVWIFSTTVFCLFTVYTWAGLPWSPFRSLVIRFHRSYMQKFGDTLQSTHSKRMQDKLAGQKACPFAMVAPPVH